MLQESMSWLPQAWQDPGVHMMPSGISSLCVGIILRFQVVVPIDIALDFQECLQKAPGLGPTGQAWVVTWSEAYIIHMK